METLSSGTLLLHGTYRVVRVLGQGGFGITYLAMDLNLQRHVAIKEFFPKNFCNRDETTSQLTIGTNSNQEFVNRLKAKFLKEARNIAKFDHPNIIRIFAAFEENNTAYYVMEYIEGESLLAMVKKQGPLTEPRAVDYIVKIGKALEYVHARNINHLDVKPANIMVRISDDTPILIDFGLSKQYDSEGNQTSTMPPCFSHGFSPLEQYNEGGVKGFSPQTDIYALGATLYFALSGVVPLQATQRNDEELTFPNSIPLKLVAPISKAMSQARKNRHPEVSEFIKDIEKASTETEETEIKKEEIKIEPDPQPSLKTTSTYEPDNDRKPPFEIWFYGGCIVAVVIIIFVFGLECGFSKNIVPDGCLPDGFSNGHGYVDLGLPSGLKWGTCNVGASLPEEIGEYFTWGGTTAISSYSEENCKTYKRDMTDISSNPDYDAAMAKWGAFWRLPTESEFVELKNKCDWTWLSQNGKNGYKVTGPNGKSIFLPAAGCWNGKSLYGVGAYGRYWSSSFEEGDSVAAFGLNFNNSSHGFGLYYRYVGQSLRPVID